MKIAFYIVTGGIGLLVSAICGILIGQIFPSLLLPVIGSLSVIWLYLGWRHARWKDTLKVGGMCHTPQTGVSMRSGQELPSCFAIGEYRIDVPAPVSHKLLELTAEEYKAFKQVFAGERTYKALPAIFMGRQWDAILGTVHGQIWKVAVFVEVDNMKEARLLTDEVKSHCVSLLGKPVEERPGLITWDANDGNVIFQTATIMGTTALNLFVTSRAIRSFAPLR